MSEMTEAKIYEAFGMTPPEQGEKVQETADPAADAATDAPEGGTEPADEVEDMGAGSDEVNAKPNADSEDPDDGDDEGQEDPDAGGDTNPKPQTPEQRRVNAARRRAQEQQEATRRAVEEAVQAEQQRQTKLFEDALKQAGLKNTATGENITTLEALQKWGQEMADGRLQQSLKSGKLTKEILDQLIEAHPAVQQAQQTVQQAAHQQAQQRAEAERVRIDGQLAKIAELNPNIKGLGDILAMDTAPAFRENVAKGMDFYDAYRLANMDSMAQAQARRAVQAAQQNTRGKEHLKATGNARGSGAASVPQAEMKLYRMMNPNMTDAQIQAHYNKYLKRGG